MRVFFLGKVHKRSDTVCRFAKQLVFVFMARSTKESHMRAFVSKPSWDTWSQLVQVEGDRVCHSSRVSPRSSSTSRQLLGPTTAHSWPHGPWRGIKDIEASSFCKKILAHRSPRSQTTKTQTPRLFAQALWNPVCRESFTTCTFHFMCASVFSSFFHR